MADSPEAALDAHLATRPVTNPASDDPRTWHRTDVSQEGPSSVTFDDDADRRPGDLSGLLFA